MGETPKLKYGDIVRLKISNIKMLVTKDPVWSPGTNKYFVGVIWFDNDVHLQYSEFTEDLLEKVE